MKRKTLALVSGILLLTAFFPNNAYTTEYELTSDAISLEEEALINEEIGRLVEQQPVLAVVYLADEIAVFENADKNSDICLLLESGHSVFIDGIKKDLEGEYYYHINCSKDDMDFQGFIPVSRVVSSDERLSELLNRYGVTDSRDELLSGSGYLDIEAFPESYKEGLTLLKQAHPNWTFVKMDTGLVWQTVVNNEMGAVSLISKTKSDAWKIREYGSGWYYASSSAVSYCLDPRNYLTEGRIFANELLTYNESYHTKEAVCNILASTFMSGEIPNEDMTYADAFFNIGSKLKVSPFHLACRVYQEQGKGTSPLISGTYEGFEGYYNYFNVGASGSSNTAIYKSGLTYAKNKGWDSRYKSLEGGAELVSKGYILRGQDTLYLQKFDVDASDNSLYKHQYMQNILAPISESSLVRKAYKDTESLENSFVFKIPVYKDMPENAVLEPGKEASPTPVPSVTPTPVPTSTVAPYVWPFTDLEKKDGNWKYEAVKYVYEKGIMTGISASTFEPDSTMTRAMFATVLYRISGSPDVSYRALFTDVADGKYYSKAVIWARDNNIISGFGNGLFKPEDKVTREQMAKMLMSYANYKKYDTGMTQSIVSYADYKDISSWAENYMKWASAAGIIKGKNSNGKTILDPLGKATRAECATMLMNFMEKYGIR